MCAGRTGFKVFVLDDIKSVFRLGSFEYMPYGSFLRSGFRLASASIDGASVQTSDDVR